jgi:predicted amidophosphoribosyltransferase
MFKCGGIYPISNCKDFLELYKKYCKDCDKKFNKKKCKNPSIELKE